MHTFLDAKILAKVLRAALAEIGIEVTHSDCLELVARQFGLNDWNMLAARIESATSGLPLPAGWIVAGVNAQLYRLGVDPEMAGTVRIERIAGTIETGDATFGTLMQSIDAREFVGRSLLFGAELMSVGAGKGSLWIRVDPAGGGRHLQFDNMHLRAVEGPLSGDVQWTRRNIAFHVPEGAGSIHYGVMLTGPGTLRARGLVLDQVDPAEVTAPRLPRRPTNLGFGDAAA